jgi:hypothetical protein
MSQSHEYTSWEGIIARTTNPKNTYFRYYGGRGIKVCARWLKFENFYADMGPRPSPKHTIDRVNNSLGYSPENCRWATRKEQQRNLRSNRIITVHGVSRCVSEWAERLGVKSHTIHGRMASGWPEHLAVTLPKRSKLKDAISRASHV